jgi:hypothetical protein
MSWKNHKKWHAGKGQEQAAGKPIERSAKPGVAEPTPVHVAAPVATVPQGNFIAKISVSPAIQKSRNLTADILQDALNTALQQLVRYEKTIAVSVSPAP